MLKTAGEGKTTPRSYRSFRPFFDISRKLQSIEKSFAVKVLLLNYAIRIFLQKKKNYFRKVIFCTLYMIDYICIKMLILMKFHININ